MVANHLRPDVYPDDGLTRATGWAESEGGAPLFATGANPALTADRLPAIGGLSIPTVKQIHLCSDATDGNGSLEAQESTKLM
jgi:hypothetical protein